MDYQNYDPHKLYFVRWFIDKWTIETLFTSNDEKQCLTILRKVFKHYPERNPYLISNTYTYQLTNHLIKF